MIESYEKREIKRNYRSRVITIVSEDGENEYRKLIKLKKPEELKKNQGIYEAMNIYIFK